MTSSFNRIDGVSRFAPTLAGYGVHPVGVRTQKITNWAQVDVLTPDLRRYDRELTVEIWYPADCDSALTKTERVYDTLLRDGITPVRLYGRAVRDAPAQSGAHPLVILSHGYPGNRLLMGHLGETLASRGYLVASIDHRDSTYADKADLISTLVNRPLDCRCVAKALGAQAYAIIGYSMGGYGALVAAGAGLSEAAVAAYGGALAQHRDVTVDPKLRAILPIGPWGGARGLWAPEGLAQMRLPMLMMAGSADTISDYDLGMRRVFEGCAGPCHLLTFQGAGHNAAAPYPAPAEAFTPSPHLPFLPAEHHVDALWDSCRMNGIAQHFAVAFLGLYLKGISGMAGYLTSDFKGFRPEEAKGLRLERNG